MEFEFLVESDKALSEIYKSDFSKYLSNRLVKNSDKKLFFTLYEDIIKELCSLSHVYIAPTPSKAATKHVASYDSFLQQVKSNRFVEDDPTTPLYYFVYSLEETYTTCGNIKTVRYFTFATKNTIKWQK